MRPWQVLGLSALLLNSLVIIAFLFADRGYLVAAVVAGALPPGIISGALLFWVEHHKINTSQGLQKINIIGFIFKVILLGIWAAFQIEAGVLDKMTFIVILLINFLAWHGVEAYYWPLFMAGNGQDKGENS
ncbi:hypothetical protein HQ531_10700 [bacterium]|nr:hypothetical protein [bacterium]